MAAFLYWSKYMAALKSNKISYYSPLLQRLHVTLHHVCMASGWFWQYPALFHDWQLDVSASSLHKLEPGEQSYTREVSNSCSISSVFTKQMYN